MVAKVYTFVHYNAISQYYASSITPDPKTIPDIWTRLHRPRFTEPRWKPNNRQIKETTGNIGKTQLPSNEMHVFAYTQNLLMPLFWNRYPADGVRKDD